MLRITSRSVAAAFIVGAALASGGAALAQSDWQTGGGEKWQKALEAARQEGKVIVAGHPALSKPISEAFKRDTGISVEFLGGQPRELATRLAREARTGNVTIDLTLGGGAEMALKAAGKLVPLKPQLILPGVTDGKKWRGGKIKWMDKEETFMLQGSNWVHAWPLFNSKIVAPGTVTTWQDLLKPEFKGKIAAYDPRFGGPGQAAAAYLTDAFGIDFVKKLYAGQQVVYTRDGRQLVEWIARGAYAVALGGIQLHVEIFKMKGVKNLAVEQMRDGPGSLLGGFSVIKQPKGSPNPAAATVFLNWYASKPGQEAYSSRMLEPSLRVDVDVKTVPDYVKPKPDQNYVDQYVEDWYTQTRPKVRKSIIEALGGR